MADPRYAKLADLLVNYSLRLKRGERLLIEVTDIPDEFSIELMRAARNAGAEPVIELRHSRVTREMVRGSDERYAHLASSIELARMKKMDAYVAVRGSANVNETSDIEASSMQRWSKIMRPVTDHRINRTRWVVLRWPSPSMAQSAGMSTEAFENFYFDVCTMDYPRMAKAMLPLQRRMRAADRVRLKAPGTDLTFSIKKIGAVLCEGRRNIPDGEVFSCPVRDSVNGQISFNAPSVYAGTRFENIRLKFKKGKIVDASSSESAKMNRIFDTDQGARYVGEFSLAFNPYILNPMGDILFDEKIAGSLHFTPGQAYEAADNGNRSAVHWDMVLIQRKEWGGGEIWFDEELIRKDGIFLPRDLKGLNPKQLR